MNEAVTINLDRERRMVLDMNALRAIEKETGRNMLAPSSWENFDATFSLAVIWASLLNEDPKLKIEDVGRMVTPANLRLALEKMAAVIKASLPGGEQADPTIPTASEKVQ